MNRECNLTRRIRLEDNSTRFCPVVLSANGRIKDGWVLINAGKEDERKEHHPEGSYYLEWREEGDKRIRLSVGKDPGAAMAQRLRKEAELNAVSHGAKIVPEPGATGRSLKKAMVEFLDDVRTKQLTNKPNNFGRHNTTGCYSTALEYFAESCHKLTLEEIDRRDLLKFAAFLQSEKKQGPRSVYNKFLLVMTFLKAHGIRGLITKYDWPKYTDPIPEIYENEELEKLFDACDPQERMWFEFFLMTGMREQEVMHAYWSDVNFTASTVHVSHKPDRSWSPKAYKEREIPIPTKLLKSLKQWKMKSDKTCSLVFPTSGCKPNRHFLEALKAVAERAKLDPDNFWLHKFRSTFCTRCLWAGFDLRTVQEWMGHKDLQSTMRYLKPQRSADVRNKVNTIFA